MSRAAGALPSDPEILRLTGEILARPEYGPRHVDDEAWLAWFARVRAFVDEWFSWLQDLSVTAPALYWTLLLGLSLCALALLAHVVLALRAALRAPLPAAPARAGATPRDFAAEAQALAAEGRFLEAARRLQLACLELALARGALSLGRSETGRALRRALERAALPERERRRFAELVARLERQVFRDRAEDRDLYEEWRGLLGALRTGAA